MKKKRELFKEDPVNQADPNQTGIPVPLLTTEESELQASHYEGGVCLTDNLHAILKDLKTQLGNSELTQIG